MSFYLTDQIRESAIMNKSGMILSVRAYVSRFGKVDSKVISAINKIDRKFFMPEEKIQYSYLDEAISIEAGQTISQPSTVARMLSLLKLKEGDKVLEIGAGSGWNACLIAEIAKKGKVLTLDIHKELIKKAKERQKKLGIKNLEIKLGDFRKLKLSEKFDKIIFTCGISEEQENLIAKFAENHLNIDGILVCPMQAGPLIIISKNKEGKITKTYTSEEYVFVPLVLE